MDRFMCGGLLICSHQLQSKVSALVYFHKEKEKRSYELVSYLVSYDLQLKNVVTRLRLIGHKSRRINQSESCASCQRVKTPPLRNVDVVVLCGHRRIPRPGYALCLTGLYKVNTSFRQSPGAHFSR